MNQPAEIQSPSAAQARLSAPAAIGFLLVIIALLGCFLSGITARLTGNLLWGVPLLATPFMSIGGAILGYLGIRQIGRSNSDVVGRGPAIFAIFVGLMAGVLQSVFVGAAVVVFTDTRTKLAPHALMLLQDIEHGRLDSARTHIGHAVSPLLSDEQLKSFQSTLEHEIGPLRDATLSLGAFQKVRELERNIAQRGGTGAQTGVPARPVELVSDTHRVLAYVWIDNDAAKNNQIKITDMIVILPGNRALLLRDGADSAKLASALGLTPIAPAEGHQPPPSDTTAPSAGTTSQ